MTLCYTVFFARRESTASRKTCRKSGELSLVGDVVRALHGVYDADPQLVAVGTLPAAKRVSEGALAALERPAVARREALGEDLVHSRRGGVFGGLIAIVDLPGAEHVPGGGLRIWRGEIAVDQMDPGLLSDDPVNRQAEQRLERPHGVIGARAEDAVDDAMGAVSAAVDLTLNGAHGVTVTSLLHLDDQLGPGLLSDDPVVARAGRRRDRRTADLAPADH